MTEAAALRPSATSGDMHRRRARVAVLVLSTCCVFWGFSFPGMQIVSAAWDRAAAGSPARAMDVALRATFLGWRFAAAAFIYWLLTRKSHRNYRPVDWTGGLAVGACLSAGMLFQIVGLRFTLPSISAFLTALAVIFAPLAQNLILRRPVSWRIWVAVLIAIAGTLLLSRSDSQAAATLAAVPPLPYLGEILTILGAMIFTAQILAVDHFGGRADVARLTLLAMATTAAVNTSVGVLLAGRSIYQPQMLWELISRPQFWSITPPLVLFTTVLTLHLMNIHQPRISPAAACVVYCLEPVFATLFSVALRTEDLTAITIGGGAVVLLAVLIVAAGERRAPAGSADAA